MEGRALRELTSSVLSKIVRPLSRKNTVCVLSAGCILKSVVLPYKNGTSTSALQDVVHYCVFYITVLLVDYFTLTACCYVTFTLLPFFFSGEYIVRYFSLLDGVFSTLFWVGWIFYICLMN